MTRVAHSDNVVGRATSVAVGGVAIALHRPTESIEHSIQTGGRTAGVPFAEQVYHPTRTMYRGGATGRLLTIGAFFEKN